MNRHGLTLSFLLSVLAAQEADNPMYDPPILPLQCAGSQAPNWVTEQTPKAKVLSQMGRAAYFCGPIWRLPPTPGCTLFPEQGGFSRAFATCGLRPSSNVTSCKKASESPGRDTLQRTQCLCPTRDSVEGLHRIRRRSQERTTPLAATRGRFQSTARPSRVQNPQCLPGALPGTS